MFDSEHSLMLLWVYAIQILFFEFIEEHSFDIQFFPFEKKMFIILLGFRICLLIRVVCQQMM